MAAIEDDGGTKTATSGALSKKLLRIMSTHARLTTERQCETLLQKVAFKCKYNNYIAVVSVLFTWPSI